MVALVFPVLLLSCAGSPSVQRVVLLGLDGFGGHYFSNFTDQLPALASLLIPGRSSFKQRSQIPAISAPNWSSILCGMPPSSSGISGNSWTVESSKPSSLANGNVPPLSGEGRIPPPLWKVARRQRRGLKVGLSFTWPWIGNLVENYYDVEVMRKGGPDEETALAVEGWIRQRDLDFIFVHFDAIDDAGHDSFWGSEKYYRAAVRTDRLIQTHVIDPLKETGLWNSTLIVVTADHGGFGGGHGGFDQANIDAPVLYFHPSMPRGIEGDLTHTSNLDISPTILKALGLGKGEYMSGNALDLFGENTVEMS